jgi:hypothetical protein
VWKIGSITEAIVFSCVMISLARMGVDVILHGLELTFLQDLCTHLGLSYPLKLFPIYIADDVVADFQASQLAASDRCEPSLRNT